MSAPAFFEPAALGRVRVKICGITRAGDAERALELGADALGINFWPRSKRGVTLEQVAPWLRDLASRTTRIGVFVNAALDAIRETLESGAIDAVQLHGDEPPEDLAALLAEGIPAFKALGVRDRRSLEAADRYPGEFILLDAFAPAEYGGSGRTLDWALGREAVENRPGRRVILAGGLTPENVAAAVRQVRPHAVDVASGVESAPGIKDGERMAAFLEQARGD